MLNLHTPLMNVKKFITSCKNVISNCLFLFKCRCHPKMYTSLNAGVSFKNVYFILNAGVSPQNVYFTLNAGVSSQNVYFNLYAGVSS